MLALKDLMGESSIGDSPISHSAFWNAPVDAVSPAQLVSFRARMALQDRGAEASNILSALLAGVREASAKGFIPEVPLLAYSEPRARPLMLDELVGGFARLPRPLPAAVLFGLELQVLADEVVTLTWKKLKASAGQLTPLARHAVNSQPVSLQSAYVFWREQDGQHLPCFGLEAEAFDAFGLVWAQLLAGYRSMAWTDHRVESALWQEALVSNP